MAKTSFHIHLSRTGERYDQRDKKEGQQMRSSAELQDVRFQKEYDTIVGKSKKNMEKKREKKNIFYTLFFNFSLFSLLTLTFACLKKKITIF